MRGKARGLSRSVSTAGSRSSRRLGLAARSLGKSNAMRLWPSRKSAPPLRLSSPDNAAARLWPLAGKTRDLPVSGRTPANAKMRSSRVLTSRSKLRQRNKSRLVSSGTTQNPSVVYTSSDSRDVTLASIRILTILTDSIVQDRPRDERTQFMPS